MTVVVSVCDRADLACERLATCFTCGGPFDPWAYGKPRQHCRACELVGAVVVSVCDHRSGT